MGFTGNNLAWSAMILTLATFSCTTQPHSKSTHKSDGNPARLSGVIETRGDCQKGYYQIKLENLSKSKSLFVESQTDLSGRFEVSIPAGSYRMWVTNSNCGAKELVDLSENTEHMLSVVVGNIEEGQQVETRSGRFPASILVEMPSSK